MLVIQKEFRRERIQAWIQELFRGWDVGLAILNAHVVPVHRDRGEGNKSQTEQREFFAKSHDHWDFSTDWEAKAGMSFN